MGEPVAPKDGLEPEAERTRRLELSRIARERQEKINALASRNKELMAKLEEARVKIATLVDQKQRLVSRVREKHEKLLALMSKNKELHLRMSERHANAKPKEPQKLPVDWEELSQFEKESPN